MHWRKGGHGGVCPGLPAGLAGRWRTGVPGAGSRWRGRVGREKGLYISYTPNVMASPCINFPSACTCPYLTAALLRRRTEMLDYELAENMEMVLLRKSVRALAILIALLAAACTTIAPDDLMGASVAGDVSRVKTLLAAKADVNAIDEYGLGFTALMLASEKGHLEVVRALLAAGADVNAKLIRGFGIGQTALSLASLNGQPEVVRALLVAGADMNAANSYGFTAFRLASDKGHLEVIRILIAAGADVNAEDPQGYTALRSASGKGHPDVVRTLLAAGADVNAKAYGTTVLREALKNGHRDIAELLRQHGSHE